MTVKSGNLDNIILSLIIFAYVSKLGDPPVFYIVFTSDLFVFLLNDKGRGIILALTRVHPNQILLR